VNNSKRDCFFGRTTVKFFHSKSGSDIIPILGRATHSLVCGPDCETAKSGKPVKGLTRPCRSNPHAHLPRAPMRAINILVAGVPQPRAPRTRVLAFPADAPVTVAQVASALEQATAKYAVPFMLLHGGRVACEDDVLAYGNGADDCADVFMEFRVCRALVGGKGGFGAMLRGTNAGKKTTNFGMSRDLNGRRIRDVEAIKAMRAAAAQGDAGSAGAGSSTDAAEEEEVRGQQDIDDEAGVAIDVEALESGMAIVSEKVADAVAEGMKAARAMRKQQKRDRKKRAREAASNAGKDGKEIEIESTVIAGIDEKCEAVAEDEIEAECVGSANSSPAKRVKRELVSG
jgi:hypothetical protein